MNIYEPKTISQLATKKKNIHVISTVENFYLHVHRNSKAPRMGYKLDIIQRQVVDSTARIKTALKNNKKQA